MISNCTSFNDALSPVVTHFMLDVDPKRILIIKPSSLGDIIHALPTLAALRSRFPEAWIAWLVKHEWAEILDRNPLLNEVLAVNFHVWHLWGLIHTIRKKKFDLVVDLQGLFRSAFIARLAGASMVVGFAHGREASPWLYTHRVALPIPVGQSWRLWNMHAVDRNLAVAKFLGAKPAIPSFWLPNHEEDRQIVNGWLTDAGVTVDDRLVAIAPLTRQVMKNWPLERFIQVAQALMNIGQVKILLIGTADQHVSHQFEAAVGVRLVNWMGKTCVRQFRVIFERVQLVIANDSAPLHSAAACGIPTVAIFGPTNPAATGPYGMHHGAHLLTSPLPCRPCGQRTCRNEQQLECLTSISVQDVVRSAEGLLAGRS